MLQSARGDRKVDLTEGGHIALLHRRLLHRRRFVSDQRSARVSLACEPEWRRSLWQVDIRRCV
jgi:hypothetical protein